MIPLKSPQCELTAMCLVAAEYMPWSEPNTWKGANFHIPIAHSFYKRFLYSHFAYQEAPYMHGQFIISVNSTI